MENFKVFQLIAILLSTISVISVNGQISTACTASMVSTFTPCINFITGSTAGNANGTGATPNQGCCGSLKSLMSSSMDCACLLITANVPVQLPINRTLALTLPRACNIGGVPVQCKAAGTPLPAPGPVPFLLPPPPSAVSPSSSGASKASAEGPAPQSDTPLDLIPASPPEEEEPEAPSATINPGIRPVLQPSASSPSYISPSSILVLLIGMTIIRFY